MQTGTININGQTKYILIFDTDEAMNRAINAAKAHDSEPQDTETPIDIARRLIRDCVQHGAIEEDRVIHNTSRTKKMKALNLRRGVAAGYLREAIDQLIGSGEIERVNGNLAPVNSEESETPTEWEHVDIDSVELDPKQEFALRELQLIHKEPVSFEAMVNSLDLMLGSEAKLTIAELITARAIRPIGDNLYSVWG